jgi:hypothetical protein
LSPKKIDSETSVDNSRIVLMIRASDEVSREDGDSACGEWASPNRKLSRRVVLSSKHTEPRKNSDASAELVPDDTDSNAISELKPAIGDSTMTCLNMDANPAEGRNVDVASHAPGRLGE